MIVFVIKIAFVIANWMLIEVQHSGHISKLMLP